MTTAVTVNGRAALKRLTVHNYIFVRGTEIHPILSTKTQDFMTKPWILSKGNFDFSFWRSQRVPHFLHHRFMQVLLPSHQVTLSPYSRWKSMSSVLQISLIRVSFSPRQKYLRHLHTRCFCSAWSCTNLWKCEKRKMRVSFWNSERSSNGDSPIPASSHTSTTSLDLFKFRLFLRPPSPLGSFILSFLTVYTRGKFSQLPMRSQEVHTALFSQGAPQASGKHLWGTYILRVRTRFFFFRQ